MQFWILSEQSQATHAAFLLRALQRFKEGGMEEEGETKGFAICSLALKTIISHR